MDLDTVEKIERAIGVLSTEEIEELYAWMDLHRPNLIDQVLSGDLAAGRLDQAIRSALEDEKDGTVRPL